MKHIGGPTSTEVGFEASRRLGERARRVIPGGVNSNVRLREVPLPLFFDRGQGAYLYDADGNRLIDFALGNGPMLLGHSPTIVIAAVTEQLNRGILYAGQHELEVDVAELLVEHIPCAQKVRFAQTGTEAVLVALRIARAATGRQKVLKFLGHYHGWADSMYVGVHPRPSNGQVVPETEGQQVAIGNDVLLATWNDEASVTEAFATHASEIAAVILEPILSNGAIDPKPGFLEFLRRVTSDAGAVLIFDEVITGFRYGLAGAQGLFGVVPDLAVFGKAIASGFPVSAVAGKESLFEGIENTKVTHAGTYNGYPVGMAAAAATLKTLADPASGTYDLVGTRGNQLLSGLKEIAASSDVPVLVQGRAPYSWMGFTTLPEISDHRGLQTLDIAKGNAFMRGLVRRGIRPYSRPAWMLSSVHTEDDVAAALEASSEALADLSREASVA